MWEELRWKFLCMYKWGGIYSQGWNWPLWLFDFPHDCLTSMTFQLYMTLHMTSGSLGIPRYITLIENMAHSRDVDNMTHEKTRHDSSGTFVPLLVCMSSCSVSGWWMSSWCVTASPPHGKVRGVFDGHLVCLMLHSHISPYLYVGMLDKFVCSWKVYVRLSVHLWTHFCMFVCLFVPKHIFAWLFVREHISLNALFVGPLANMSFFMYSLCSSHLPSQHVCLCTFICSHSWWDDIKSINLLVYHDAWSFRMQVTERGDRLWGMSWDGGSGHYWWKLRRSH